jgi:hypothetical protein
MAAIARRKIGDRPIAKAVWPITSVNVPAAMASIRCDPRNDPHHGQGGHRPRRENVVDLMDALKKSIAGETSPAKGKKPRKASAGQKEMLLPIEGKGRAQKNWLNPNGRPDAARRDRGRCQIGARYLFFLPKQQPLR